MKLISNIPLGICAFSEVAVLYFPFILKSSASRRLRNEIEKNEELFRKLQETGYTRKNIYLTVLQKKLIFTYLRDVRQEKIELEELMENNTENNTNKTSAG